VISSFLKPDWDEDILTILAPAHGLLKAVLRDYLKLKRDDGLTLVHN